jgi:hypothetical protein
MVLLLVVVWGGGSTFDRRGEASRTRRLHGFELQLELEGVSVSCSVWTGDSPRSGGWLLVVTVALVGALTFTCPGRLNGGRSWRGGRGGAWTMATLFFAAPCCTRFTWLVNFKLGHRLLWKELTKYKLEILFWREQHKSHLVEVNGACHYLQTFSCPDPTVGEILSQGWNGFSTASIGYYNQETGTNTRKV